MCNLTRSIIVFFLLVFLSGCIAVENPFEGLPPGPWRLVLKLDSRPVFPNPKGKPLPEKVGLQFEEVTEGELPVQFEVIYKSKDQFYIEIRNGEERIKVDDIVIGKDRKTGKDTVIIRLPAAEGSYLRGIFEENLIEGEWVIPGSPHRSIPILARHGRVHRFTTLKKTPVTELTGRWEAAFDIEKDQPLEMILEFQQNGNHLLANFRSEDQEFLNLEGTIQEDKIYLSRFDGSQAILIEAKINPDRSIIGSFRSGKTEKLIWEARLKQDPEK